MEFNDRAPATNRSRGVIGVRLAERPHVRPREAAQVLECAPAAVKALLQQGRLTDSSVDRLVRIDVGSLEKLVREEMARGHLSPAALDVLTGIVEGRRVAKRACSPRNTPLRNPRLDAG
jgi:hypothetical protein